MDERLVGVRNTRRASYVYCLVWAPSAPPVTGIPRGLAGLGRPRVLEAPSGLFVVVADAPLDTYGASAINAGLSDLNWVSRAAVSHERVIEHFIGAPAVLPMKLFTIFNDDERVLKHVATERRRFARLVKRVRNHDEWGIRVSLGPRPVRGKIKPPVIKASSRGGSTPGGIAYLSRKRAERDRAIELASRAADTASSVYNHLSERAKLGKRRGTSELPEESNTLVLDAAFLVPRSRAASFRAAAVREARRLAPDGYAVRLTGPWPPYTFVQD